MREQSKSQVVGILVSGYLNKEKNQKNTVAYFSYFSFMSLFGRNREKGETPRNSNGNEQRGTTPILGSKTYEILNIEEDNAEEIREREREREVLPHNLVLRTAKYRI